MILYNMRYRGALEYDKFVLNALQYHNWVTDLMNNEFGESSQDMNNLIALQNQITETYNNSISASIELHKMLLNYKEG